MSIFEGKNILITGAGGFIGSRLAEKLVQSGAKLRVFIRYNSRADTGLLQFLAPGIFDQIDIVFGDLRDGDAIEKAAQWDGGSIDLIFHLAALISIPYSYLHPVETIESNLLGTLNVLQACRKNGGKLVHTSTSEVYGTALKVPIDENHPLQGQSPYSASKIGADKLVEAYFKSFNVSSLTIRPFNTYGPGQSARAIIPTIISQALTQEKLKLGSLNTMRDFTYLDDTVNGFMLGGEKLLLSGQNSSILGEVINLGSGSEITIGEIAHMILGILDRVDMPILTDVERLRPEKSEVMRLLADNSKAEKLLGWVPQIPLLQGLERTISWIRAHPKLYRPEVYER